MTILLTLWSTRGYVSVVYSCFETKVFESFYLLLLKYNTPSISSKFMSIFEKNNNKKETSKVHDSVDVTNNI